jgi:hypothetical protein
VILHGSLGALALAAGWVGAASAEETVDQRCRLASPLAFVAAQGAALDVSRWKSVRHVTLRDGEDLYTVTLAAGDVALLRPDLADVRLADESGHQVPYILEADTASERVTLAVERLSNTADRQEQRTHLSRYALRTPTAADRDSAFLPLRALSLTFTDSFFQRYARLTTRPRPGARSGRSQAVFAGELARGPGEEGPIEVALDGRRVEGLTLEIDEGDNTPLTLSAAQGVLSVPRLVFKARPGSYRLLLGNPQADAPRYDLAALRREVLCYSARMAAAGPLEVNPAYRRSMSEYFRAAPPTLLLWGVLIVAVAALLWLTLRILHAEPAPPRTEHPTADDRGRAP